MTAPASPAQVADTNLRDALIAHIADRHFLLPGQAAVHADALMAGPLAGLLAGGSPAQVADAEAGRLPADIAAAIEKLMQASRSEGYAMAVGVEAKEAQAERNANSARLALEAAILARLAAAAEAELDNLRRIHRWNVEHHGGEVLVCRNNHDKGDDCEWERFVPEERLTAALARAERLEKDIADTEATRDHFREKLAEMYDHHAAALARAERLETALEWIADHTPATQEFTLAHEMGDAARAALSPAAE